MKPDFRSIWSSEALKYPVNACASDWSDEALFDPAILIGDGMSFFDGLDKDIALHLMEAKAYKSGMVALRYEVRR